MNKYTEIIPGVGIGQLKFGLSRTEAEALLGKPDEVEKYSHSSFHDEPTEAWHYDELELSLGFDESDDWRLVNIATTSEQCQIDGNKLFGHSHLALMNLLKSLGFDDLEAEETKGGQKLVTSDEKAINFWIENGELTEVQIGPFYKNEDTVAWPE